MSLGETTNTTTNVSVSDIPEWQQQYQKQIMDRAQGLGMQGQAPPRYNVASRTPLQGQATGLAQSGIGSYQPMLEAGAGSVGAGVNAQTAGIGTMQNAMNPMTTSITAAGNIGSTTAANILNPNAAQAYMNPYETSVVDQTMADIGRAGQIAGRTLDAGAVGQGAFGGSRAQIAQTENTRNTIDAQARAAGQLRQSGYDSAQDQQYNRAVAAGTAGFKGAELMQTGATGMSNMAQGLGSLGNNLGAAGMNQAKLGEAQQGLNLNDINTLNQIGGQEQGQTQAEFDAIRQNEYQNYMQPYQNLGFYSDIFQGMPTSQSSFMQQNQPGPNSVSQGLGMAGGLYSLGQKYKP